MPSTLTEIDVINRALILLGDRQITSRTENTERARIMNALFDGIRDKILRECPWNFATEQLSLAADISDPLYGFGNRYAYPSDFLYMIEIQNDEDYTLQGNYIHANSSTGLVGGALYIEYVKRVTDMSQADSLFVESLSLKLAHDACENITQSNTKKEQLLRDYENSISMAKRLNGQEKPSKAFVEDAWISVRT
jgi:hypothetical protein